MYVENTKDIHCFLWCFQDFLYPEKANVSLKSTYVHHCITMKMFGINNDN